jgi:hypothetical protein
MILRVLARQKGLIQIPCILKLFIEKPVNAMIEIALNFFGFVK